MNEYLIKLQAKLDEVKSKGLINADLEKLQEQINKLKLQIEPDPNVLSDLARQLEAITSQEIIISGAAIDQRQIRKIGQDIGNAVSQGISDALYKSNIDPARAVGMDLEEYAGMIDLLAEKTGLSVSQIETSMRTFITRTTPAGEMSGMDESARSDAEAALQSIGIEVRKADSEFQDFNVTIGELAKQWDMLSDMQQSNIASGLIGTSQIDIIQALVQNWSDYENRVNKANDTTDITFKNQENQAESLSETLGELSSIWENISNDDIDASFLKGIADAGTAISSLVEKIGLLKTAVGLGIVGFFNKGRSNTILPSMGVTPYCKL